MPEHADGRTASDAAVAAMAEALGWSWEGDPSEHVPSSEQVVMDMLRDLHDLGYEVVPLDHEGCAAAVRHVAETHHGPDYPNCTSWWRRLLRGDDTPQQGLPTAKEIAAYEREIGRSS